MNIPKFTLFEHRLEEKYSNIFKQIPALIKGLRLANSLDGGDLKKIKNDAFDQLWKTWDGMDFEIKTSGITVQNQEFNFERSIATEIIGASLPSTLTTEFVTLYYAIYTVPFSGEIEAIKYTPIYPKEQVYLADHSDYFALTIYSLHPIKVAAETIKHEKDRILDLITKNQEANKAYIKSKEGLLKDAIDKEIDFHFKSGRDEISDNSLLL